ncbi:hypothetical protein L1987_53918 [Smallanthus sonchifolius]|uniref:Uncharacterized protein n=1 Tax=Smallanthus sonchifolius TaxID=185202 RepID=A0ACB9E5L8_9ASTR|nr:hypothetical protein L1987_53918 [Smallanthus sonchifolius]
MYRLELLYEQTKSQLEELKSLNSAPFSSISGSPLTGLTILLHLRFKIHSLPTFNYLQLPIDLLGSMWSTATLRLLRGEALFLVD